MEYCNGCLCGCRNSYAFYDHKEEKTIYCPCGTCIVKVVCRSTCEDLEIYFIRNQNRRRENQLTQTNRSIKRSVCNSMWNTYATSYIERVLENGKL